LLISQQQTGIFTRNLHDYLSITCTYSCRIIL